MKLEKSEPFPQGGYKKAFEDQVELTNVFFELSMGMVDSVAQNKKEVELLQLRVQELEMELQDLKMENNSLRQTIDENVPF